MRRSTISLSLAAAWVVTVPTGLRAQEVTLGEGAQVYAASCGRCHNVRAPGERSDREWAVIVAHMRTRGNLTGREARAVQYFLQATNVSEGDAGNAATETPRPSRVMGGRTTGGMDASDEWPLAGPHQTEVEFGATSLSDTGLVEQGARLVDSKGCMACHKVGKYTTGILGPDLNTVLSRREAEYILRKLAQPAFDNPVSVMPQMNLSAEERDALLAYLTSIAKK